MALMNKQQAIIIGAGPAGLTAAYELLDKTDIKPVIFEMSNDLGGIARTVNYKGNRIDIGGHRFFSKSDRVVKWWKNIMPLQGALSKDDLILERNIPLSKEHYQRRLGEEQARKIPVPDPEETDTVMLIRQRLSRILFLRKFFDYPVSPNKNTINQLGIVRITKILLSYIKARIFPIKKEKNLEDFFINRFGKELYQTFFEDYTEKVWGVPCHRIKPEWGAQRIKGLSISKALVHAIRNIFVKDSSIGQKNVETSLIGQFMYPKFGPGQMWEEVARLVQEKDAEVYLENEVIALKVRDNRIEEIKTKNTQNGDIRSLSGDYFFSTMAVKDLIKAMGESVPPDVQEIAQGLVYRDFITVGVLLKKLKVKNNTKFKSMNDLIPDNWIYIQEPDVKIARIQIFNNWSPYMVKDPDTVWLGLEYMCNIGDELWEKKDDEFMEFAKEELMKINMVDPEDIIDQVVIRTPKAYPAYFGTYEHFEKIRDFTDRIENLFLIGRNGMHRYNNQDHSMLTAMVAVENIIENKTTKDNIWSVNVEKDYHEEK